MRLFAIAALSLLGCHASLYQFRPDVTEVSDVRQWSVHNGEATASVEQGKAVLTLAPKGGNHEKGSNVAIAEARGLAISSGVVEVDLKGNGDASFVGVAFNIENSTQFEAIYFRPFRFRSDDPEQKKHAVQYVAWPGHDWESLRQASPGKYESALEPAPDPAQWFHARIEVGDKQVKVFVNGAAEPSLVVDRLAAVEKRRVGLFVDSQPGSFAELTVRPD